MGFTTTKERPAIFWEGVNQLLSDAERLKVGELTLENARLPLALEAFAGVLGESHQTNLRDIWHEYLQNLSYRVGSSMGFCQSSFKERVRARTCLVRGIVNRGRQDLDSLMKRRGLLKTKPRYTEGTVQLLKSAFETNKYPSSRERKRIAALCNLTALQVRVWFSNRRNRKTKASSRVGSK